MPFHAVTPRSPGNWLNNLCIRNCSFLENGKSQPMSCQSLPVIPAFGQPFLCSESQHWDQKLYENVIALELDSNIERENRTEQKDNLNFYLRMENGRSENWKVLTCFSKAGVQWRILIGLLLLQLSKEPSFPVDHQAREEVLFLCVLPWFVHA